MKFAIYVRLLAALLMLPIGAQARESVPVMNFDNVPVVTGSGVVATPDQVRKTITSACQSRQWQVTNGSTPDTLSATLNVRGKHTAVVAISFAADKYSIKYLNSINLHYKLSDYASSGSTDLTKLNAPTTNVQAGTPMIHPAYNKWVQELRQAIQFELKNL